MCPLFSMDTVLAFPAPMVINPLLYRLLYKGLGVDTTYGQLRTIELALVAKLENTSIVALVFILNLIFISGPLVFAEPIYT